MLDDLIELPEGWEETTLGELGEWSSGGTPSRSHSEYYGGEIPWVKTGNLSDGLIYEIDETITPEGLAKSSAKIFPKDSLLIAMYGATIGKLGLLKEPAATNQACAGLLAKGLTSDLIPFSFYYLLHCRDDFRDIGQGGAQPNISQTILKEYPIYLPPLNEQKRIVAKIEELRSHTQAARNAIAHIPKLLEQFRQSVLAAAFRGDLTAEWRSENPDVEPAEVLLERIRKERRDRWESNELEKMRSAGKMPKDDKWKAKYQKTLLFSSEEDLQEIPVIWKWIKLNDLCSNIADVDHKMPRPQENGIPYISTKNFFGKEQINFDTAKKISHEDFENLCKKVKPEFGDILLSRYGTIGEVRLIQTNSPFQASYSIAIIKPVKQELSRFLTFALRSEQVRIQIKKYTRGVAQPDLGLAHIKELFIPIPSQLEQVEIISKIKEAFEKIDRIEQQYQFIKTELDRLDRSILAKAFKGELVPQDPTDEPAIVLLERIRNDRASQVKPAKTKRKKA